MEYLVQLRGRWYYRRRVPADLTRHFPYPQLKRSLGTRYRSVAKPMAAALSAEAERLFLAIRMRMLSDDQIRSMVADFLRSALDGSEKRRAAKPGSDNAMGLQGNVELLGPIPEKFLGKPLTGVQQRSIFLTHLSKMCQGSLATGASLGLSKHTEAADLQLKAAGLDVAKDSLEYRNLLRALAKAHVDFLKIESERCLGEYDSDIERRVMERIGPALATPSSQVASAEMIEAIAVQVAALVVPKRPAVTLQRAVDHFLDHQKIAGNKGKGLAPSTLEKYGQQFPLLVDLLGGKNRLISDVAPTEFLEVRKQLLNFPSRWKTGRYRHLSLEEVLQAEIPPGHRLHTRSVNTYMSRAMELFGYAAKPGVGWLPLNPAQELLLALTEDEELESKQLPFTDAELVKLFEIVPNKKRAPHEAWLPLVAAHSGGSLAELAQLRVDDVREVDGLMCLDILVISQDRRREKEDIRRTKTSSRRRLVPVHDLLVQVGFLEWVDQGRAKGQRDLFPCLLDEKKRRNYGGQNFRRIREQITDQPSKKTFHSFRHTVQDHLKRVRRVDMLLYHAIVGHRINDRAQGALEKLDMAYTMPFDVRTLYREAISLIDYGLDVEAIARRYRKLL